MLFIFLLHNTYSYKGLVYSFSPIYLRSEFPTFRDDGVEVAEGEEDALELCLLGAHLEGVLVKVVERLVQVGLHPRRRLVGDLDGGLEYALRYDVVLGGRGRLGAQEYPVRDIF